MFASEQLRVHRDVRSGRNGRLGRLPFCWSPVWSPIAAAPRVRFNSAPVDGATKFTVNHFSCPDSTVTSPVSWTPFIETWT